MVLLSPFSLCFPPSPPSVFYFVPHGFVMGNKRETCMGLQLVMLSQIVYVLDSWNFAFESGNDLPKLYESILQLLVLG